MTNFQVFKDFSKIAYPLTELTHKPKSYVWIQGCQIAFEILRCSLITDPILSHPTENGEFILDTDASLHGIGAVLSQSQYGEKSNCLCKQNFKQNSAKILHHIQRTVSSGDVHKTVPTLSLGAKVYCKI